MELAIVFLMIPSLGLALYLSRHWLLEGDRNAHRWLRLGVELIGWLCLGLAAGFIVWGILQALRSTWDSLLLIQSFGRFVVVLLLVWTGRACLAVGRHSDESHQLLSVRTRQAVDQEHWLIGIVGLIILPAVVPLSLMLLAILVGLAVDQIFRLIVQRGRENRLLWTLAVAAQFKRPLDEEVFRLAEDERGAVRWRLNDLAGSLRAGSSLSHAILTSRKLLPREMGAAMQVGEETGRLPEMVRDLAERHTQRIRESRVDAALSQTMAYSLGVCLVAASLISGVMVFIVPKFKELFVDFGLELPQLTQGVIAAADLMAGYWYILIPLLALPFLLAAVVLYVGVAGPDVLPSFILSLWPRLTSPMLLRSLGAGAVAKECMNTVLLRLEETSLQEGQMDRFRRVRLRLEQGDELARTLHEERLVNRREARAISHAEAMGHLSWALQAIADRMENVRQSRVEKFTAWLQPVLIWTIGLVVLFFTCGMFMPLVKLIEDLS